MSQSCNRIDPSTTDCLLKNLGLAIEEIKLLRSIENITEQVETRDAAQLESGRRKYLTTELRFLNKRLRAVREKAAAG